MKKLITVLFALLLAVGLAGCSGAVSEETKENITIKSLNANKEPVDLEVPYNPERIAVLDMAALDILDNIGVGKNIVGSASTSIEYLSKYSDNKDIANLGTIKEADLEAVAGCTPDIIFIGGRLSASYDELSKIAPVVYLATDSEVGVVDSTVNNAKTIASIFGLEDKIDDATKDFNSRIEKLQEVATGKTALIGMTTSGSFNLLGNDGRCSIIGVEIGFENLTDGDITSTHGNESSFETVVSKNPDYVFVMDRDQAIGSEGASTAKEILENDLIKSIDAYRNEQIIYLSNSNVWYTAEGGITALDIMLQDLETMLIK